MINNLKVCIFGGAIGDTRKINYSNETYIYNILTKLWIKLEVGNNKALPQERAAHAAAVNDNTVMMIYGGSTKNGGLAEDEIWLLYLNEGAEGEGEWKRYQVTNGQSPGPRYGHSLNFIKPFFVLFGGNFNPSLSNDVWIVNINEKIGDSRNKFLSLVNSYYNTLTHINKKIKDLMVFFYWNRKTRLLILLILIFLFYFFSFFLF